MKEYEKILENRKKATASTQKWRNKQKKKALEPTYQIEPEPTAGDPEAMKEYEKILENRKKATASTQKWRNKQKKKALEPTYQIEPEPTELEPEQELPVTASA